MTVLWAVISEKVNAAIERVIRISKPRKVILFGSCARGETGLNSDADSLIITDDTATNCRQESVRIRRSLRGISMAMDILVIPESRFEELVNQPGLIYREAAKHGKVVYESSSYKGRMPTKPENWLVHAESDLDLDLSCWMIRNRKGP